MLIAVPIGMSEEEWTQQSCTLHNGFITYLQQKQAAGIINITAPGSTQVYFKLYKLTINLFYLFRLHMITLVYTYNTFELKLFLRPYNTVIY